MATRQMLSRATEGTNAPTPGYLLKDLAIAAQTNPTTCQEMATYLIQRLSSKQNPNIKYKCLNVISKIANQVPHFKRSLAQSPHGVAEIKAHINYRGMLDPVRGDEPNAKVRQAAQEALDAVYRETPTSMMTPPASSTMMSASYGGAPHQQSYASGGGGPHSRRMDGIGNPMFTDPRLDPRYNGTVPTTIGEAVREAGEVVLGMIKDPLARNIEIAPSVGGVPNRGFGELPQYQRPGPPGADELRRQTQGQWTMASNRGPNAVGPPASSSTNAATSSYQREKDYYHTQPSIPSTRVGGVGGVGGSWGNTNTTANNHTTPSIHITPHPNALPPSNHTTTPSSVPTDGSYERNLILELCPPSGMKAVPPPDKLATFSKLVPSLNPDFVCPALLDCLEEGQPWIIRAKALCVMETTLYNGARADGSGHNPYRDFFHACHEEIVPLASHPRAAIAGPAKRVLALLGVAVDTTATTSNNYSSSSQQQQQPAPNLLDFDDGTATPASSSAPPPPQDNGSLFGGMQVKSTSSAAAPAAAPVATESLLDFGGSNAAPSAATTSAGQDIFRPESNSVAGATASVAATTTTTTSLFEQMTLKTTTGHEDKKTDSEDAGDLTNGGGAAGGMPSSAFGFINASASKDSTEHAAVPPPPPSAASFDPLQNFSPTTAKKSMAMSPEQMQAMAYQQMMMQQQMQMQRMMMQQQSPGMPYPMMVGGAPGMPMVPGMVPMPGGVGGAGAAVGHHPPGVGAGGSGTQGMMMMANMFKVPPPAKKDDKKFDFVKDAMHTAGKK